MNIFIYSLLILFIYLLLIFIWCVFFKTHNSEQQTSSLRICQHSINMQLKTILSVKPYFKKSQIFKFYRISGMPLFSFLYLPTTNKDFKIYFFIILEHFQYNLHFKPTNQFNYIYENMAKTLSELGSKAKR